MCWISTPSTHRRRAVVVREEPWDAPRPVSNFHGGPSHRPSTRESLTYVRRTTSPLPRDRRVSYNRRSFRSSGPRLSDGGEVYERRTRTIVRNIGRSHSVRSGKSEGGGGGGSKHRFTMSSLRGLQQPELSKRLYRLIKTENHQIAAYEAAARESGSVATQLSEWGDSTDDDALSDISDKLAVLLAEIAEQEDAFAQNLEDSRGVLKQIRNTEGSVQPSRNHKAKIADEIAKLKYKEPESTKLVTLEQELVRAEAQSLVAEAQLTNVTRQQFKRAYDLHTAAIVERAEKQMMLARHARRLLDLLDDTPIVPGEERGAFAHAAEAREVLNDAEADLRRWSPSVEPVASKAGTLGVNAMPAGVGEKDMEERAMPAAEEKVRVGGDEQQQQQQPPYPTEETGSEAAAAAA